MKCLGCGQEMPDDAIFCTNCGSQLKSEDTKKQLNKKPRGLDVPLNIFSANKAKCW